MQLAPIYTQAVDTIQIAFSEHVLIDEDALTLFATGERHGDATLEIDSIDFDFDPNSHTATWMFPTLGGDKYRIDIAASDVMDVSGLFLDGHWDNLTEGTLDDWTDDPDAGTFVSGNGMMGGSAFQFLFALLPGDYDQNGIVDVRDQVLWNDEQIPVDGDGDGNGIGDSGDYDVWSGEFENQLRFLRTTATTTTTTLST